MSNTASNAKVMPIFRRAENFVARYDWRKPTAAEHEENKQKLVDESLDMYLYAAEEATTSASYIELYKDGNAIYNYVYTTKGDYYEWVCKYMLGDDGTLMLSPYFTWGKATQMCELFEIDDRGLKYIGEWEMGSSNPPRPEQPFSMYINYDKAADMVDIKPTAPKNNSETTTTTTRGKSPVSVKVNKMGLIKRIINFFSKR